MKRFNALPSALQSLLDGMLRVNPKERLKLADVARPRGSPGPVGRRDRRPSAPAALRRAAASHESLAAPDEGTTLRGMAAAADEAEEPRLNACSAQPDSAASGGGEGDRDVTLEAVKPPIRSGAAPGYWSCDFAHRNIHAMNTISSLLNTNNQLLHG